MELRPYQKDAVKSVIQHWGDGERRLLISLPTGCGKTIIFADVAQKVSNSGRVLVLAHRDELLQQAEDKIYRITGMPCAYEKAGDSAVDSLLPITVGSVQTLMNPRRLERFSPDHYRTIIVDEAHHALSDSYQRVLEYFNDANVLGVTATPDRGDKRNLAQYFDALVYEYPLKSAVKEGHLCPITAKMIGMEIDLSKVRTSMGDYTDRSLDEALDPYLEDIARTIASDYADRKTVVFLPLIATSQRFRDYLERYGMSAAEVNGNSPDRKEILRDFEAGRYQILCNSMLLTEGWDCPSVDCIVVLRPTKIRSLYVQMVGRGMRPAPGKKNLLLLDFLWMTQHHSLVCKPSSLFGKDEETRQRVDEMMMQEDFLNLLDAEDQAERDIVTEREKALAEELRKMKARKSKIINPLEFITVIGDYDLSSYVPTFDWELQPVSEKQAITLEKFYINPEQVQNKGVASQILNVLFDRSKKHLATVRQMKVLNDRGFPRASEWTFAEASKALTALSEYHWRALPPQVFERLIPERLKKELNPWQE